MVTGALLGIAAVVGAGVSDFSGGFAARKLPVIGVTAISQFTSVLFVCLMMLLFPPDHVRAADVITGAIGGILLVAGLQCMFRALAHGSMGVLAAAIGVSTALVPFTWALLRGEKFVTEQWVAVAFALLSLIMASQGAACDGSVRLHRQQVALAVLAGTLFGFAFVALGFANSDSGLVSVLAMRITTAVVAVVACRRMRVDIRGNGAATVGAALSGVAGTSALALFVWAAHIGVVSTVAILQSLAPVVVGGLAFTFLGQKLNRAEVLGVVLAIASAALFAS